MSRAFPSKLSNGIIGMGSSGAMSYEDNHLLEEYQMKVPLPDDRWLHISD
jgi:hypothetical protein